MTAEGRKPDQGPAPRHEPVHRFDAIWRGWEHLSPATARFAQHQEDRGPFLAALERCLRGAWPPRALEVGCGSAIDLALLAEKVPGVQAVGADLSMEALRVARTFVGPLGGRAALCQGDVFALPFASGGFGMVFSQGVLEHFRGPAAALREQVRVLAPGGYLTISVPQTFTGYTLHKHRAIRRGVWPWGWEGQFTGRALARLGRAQGLQVLEVFGYQYWRSWHEPAWVLRDLVGKFHRRNPWAARWPFPQVHRLYESLWARLERRWGRHFLQNVAVVFRKGGATRPERTPSHEDPGRRAAG